MLLLVKITCACSRDCVFIIQNLFDNSSVLTNQCWGLAYVNTSAASLTKNWKVFLHHEAIAIVVAGGPLEQDMV